MIKQGIVVAGGLVVLMAICVALVLGRNDQETATPEVQAAEPVPAPEFELVAPGEAEAEPVVAQADDGKWVDELGLEWDQLSFDNPQIQPHPDGGVIMRKLIRVYSPDGTVDEQPVMVRGKPRQKRMPIMIRKPPGQEHERVGPKPIEETGEPQVDQPVDQ